MTASALNSDQPLELLRRLMADSKQDDPLARVTILAPSNIAGVTARRHLASHGGVAAIDVTTVQRFAETLASSHLGRRRPATRAMVTAAWREELIRDPGAFADVAAHPATVSALARAHNNPRELDEQQFDSVAAQALPAPDLVRLFRAVRASLTRRTTSRTSSAPLPRPPAGRRPRRSSPRVGLPVGMRGVHHLGRRALAAVVGDEYQPLLVE